MFLALAVSSQVNRNFFKINIKEGTRNHRLGEIMNALHKSLYTWSRTCSDQIDLMSIEQLLADRFTGPAV